MERMKIAEYIESVFASLDGGVATNHVTIDRVTKLVSAGDTYAVAVVKTAYMAKGGREPTPKTVAKAAADFEGRKAPGWLVIPAPQSRVRELIRQMAEEDRRDARESLCTEILQLLG